MVYLGAAAFFLSSQYRMQALTIMLINGNVSFSALFVCFIATLRTSLTHCNTFFTCVNFQYELWHSSYEDAITLDLSVPCKVASTCFLKSSSSPSQTKTNWWKVASSVSIAARFVLSMFSEESDRKMTASIQSLGYFQCYLSDFEQKTHREKAHFAHSRR
jgi:hypothetical protein